MWLEEVGFGSVEEQAADALEAKVRTGAGSTAMPDVEELFEFNSYDGGAVILHALRLTIGDDRFFEVLQRWVADNAGESRHTEDFVALAGEVSGTDLTAFFADWLYSDSVPDGYPVPVDG
jgi:aminopeptidase N